MSAIRMTCPRCGGVYMAGKVGRKPGLLTPPCPLDEDKTESAAVEDAPEKPRQTKMRRLLWHLNPVGVGLLAGDIAAYAGVMFGFYRADTAWPILPLIVVWSAVSLAWPRSWKLPVADEASA